MLSTAAHIGARLLSDHMDIHTKYACCTMQGNPATGADVTGMLLFRQTTGECIRIFGELSVNDGTTQIEA